MADGNMSDSGEAKRGSQWRALAWAGLGLFFGWALAAIFMAYGQPELLIEQLNLRYCG